VTEYRESLCSKALSLLGYKVALRLHTKMMAVLPAICAATGKIVIDSAFAGEPYDPHRAADTARQVLRELIPDWDEHVPPCDRIFQEEATVHPSRRGG
jgi:hypothetical protein